VIWGPVDFGCGVTRVALQDSDMVERQRTLNLNVRITEEEAEMLRALAKRRGLSASDIVRQYIRSAHAKEIDTKNKR
jgi:uncharacterized protein (DUF1778 family)